MHYCKYNIPQKNDTQKESRQITNFLHKHTYGHDREENITSAWYSYFSTDAFADAADDSHRALACLNLL